MFSEHECIVCVVSDSYCSLICHHRLYIETIYPLALPFIIRILLFSTTKELKNNIEACFPSEKLVFHTLALPLHGIYQSVP